ncbi:MAG: hypothetical protein V7694_23450 [Rhodococcus sp. (in: high G+C Gram-positive bacteria)]
MTAHEVSAKPRSRRGPMVCIAAIAAALFVLRGLPRMREPALFAEDGQIFLAEAHNNGASAIITPYAGYLHLIPRLIAAILEPLPVTAAPVAYLWAAVIVHLIFLTPALSARLAWLLPSPVLRGGLFASLCLMAPLWEPYGNIANLIFVAGLSLLLLVLGTDPARRVTRGAELAGVGLIGLSGPLVVLFLPFFGWRWWRNGRSRHSLHVAAVAAATALVQATVYLSSERSTPGGGTLVLLAKTAGQRVGGSWLYGDADVLFGTPHPVLTAAAYLWFALVVALTVLCLPRIALPLWLLCVILLYSAVNAYGPAMVSSSQAFQRHILIPVAICIVLLWAVIGSHGRSIPTAVALVCLLAGGWGIVHDFAPDPYPLRPDLGPLRLCVEAGTDSCQQEIFLPGWSVDLSSRQSW